MPAFVARAAYRSTVAGTAQDVVNVLHFEAAQLTSPFDPTAVANDISTRLTTLYRAMCGTNTTVHDLTVTDATLGEDAPTSYVKSIELAGTRSLTNTDLGSGLCGVIALKSGVAKRYARGHIFAPPAFASNLMASGGEWVAGGSYKLAMDAFATQVKSGWSSGDTAYGMVIYSRTRWTQSLTPYYFPISDAVVRWPAHWLRSRSGLAQ